MALSTGPADPFGRQMLLNLEARGCPLRGISGAPDLEGQKTRFTASGFRSAGAVDMNGAYAALLTADAADVRRIERLEIFDELEEWHLIQAHYCIAWGVGPARICSTDQHMFNPCCLSSMSSCFCRAHLGLD